MLHMRRILLTVALIAVTSPLLAADVAVSVSIGEPGFYGRIDIGDYPQPRVIYRQPIIVERVVVDRPPIYMRVPPGHAKNWRKHCREYNACGERVLFVQDTWYSHEYVPRYRERHSELRERDGRGERQGDVRDERRSDDRDRSAGGNGRKKNGDNNGRNR